jgi:transcriptional regulator with GAF, ATPase, and Fis domain
MAISPVRSIDTVADDVPLLLGEGLPIEQLRSEIEVAARSDSKVLITGETGVGKEVVARLVHHQSARRHQPFVTLNCAAVPDSLLESELFGHVRGSFTDAYTDKPGLAALADRGTLFLDEIGEMSPRMQAVLLRFTETQEIHRVGSDRVRTRVDARIVAATNRHLPDRIASGDFRQDLYYRLNVFAVHLPPLRQRKGDIALLIDHFCANGFRPAPDILATLLSYDWPGNVRELKNCIERMEAMHSEGGQYADLPSALLYHRNGGGLQQLSEAIDAEQLSAMPHESLAPRSPVISIPDSTREAIVKALAATGGNRGEAARILRIGRTTLYRKMKEYRID